MSDSIVKKKLVLNRETVVPLQHDDLDNVNGGTGWFCAGARSVYQSIQVIGNLYASYQASQAVTQATQGGGGGGQPPRPASRYQMTPGGCAD